MSKITKAVIPAAGLGRRLKPITNYLPKSMLPLGKKPVLEHIVDELLEASVDEIAIVAPSNQTAIFRYFKNIPEVEFIIDDSRSGPGGAILHAREFIAQNDFIVIFADAPVKGEKRGENLKELINIKKKEDAEAALSVYKVPPAEISSRGMVIFENNARVTGASRIADIIEKPSTEEVESTWVSACRYVLSPSIFDALENIERDEQEELQLTTAIRYLINNEGKSVLGYPLKDGVERYDTGNFKGYFEAFREFSGEKSE